MSHLDPLMADRNHRVDEIEMEDILIVMEDILIEMEDNMEEMVLQFMV